MNKRISKLQPKPVAQPQAGQRVWHPDSGTGTVMEPYSNGYSQVQFDSGALYTSGNCNLYTPAQ